MRILFVARPYSVHTARWINQIADEGWDLHLFPTSESTLHPDYRNITTYYIQRDPRAKLDPSVRTRMLWPLSVGGYRLGSLANRLLPSWSDRAAWLARIIRWLKPDMVHSLEFQEAGYLTLRARELYEGRFPPWVVSNWGSDIYLFGPLAEHREKIKGILSGCDYYSCECHRDVALAREYGFKGEVLPVLPIAGGFHIEKMQQYRQPGVTSVRRLVALKGYQHWAGRALVGLHAIEQCADVLKARGFSVAVYLAKEDVRIAAERMALKTGLRVEIIPSCSHEEMLRLHGRSRVSVGLSISDGLSTSALEALVMGAFPVQSNTSCLTELLGDKETALMVPSEDPAAVAAAVQRAVTDDALVDRAVAFNDQVIASRLEYSTIQSQVIVMYKQAVAREWSLRSA